MKVKHSTFATLNPIIIKLLKTKKDRENEREEKVGVGI
jgi:CRISPR/Cas system endoribonuclease Cas6 (RAMP superfamily)